MTLVVGFMGGLILAFGEPLDAPMALMLAALVMVLLASVATFVIVWRDSRACNTGWWRSARRAFGDSLRLLWDLIS